MRVAVFSTKPFDKVFLEQYNVAHKHTLVFFEQRLTELSARLVAGFSAVCVFANDVLNRTVLTILSENGVRLIALRCAGFNNVDLVTTDIQQGPVEYSWGHNNTLRSESPCFESTKNFCVPGFWNVTTRNRIVIYCPKSSD